MILNKEQVSLFNTNRIKRLIETHGSIDAEFNDGEENRFLYKVIMHPLDEQNWLQNRWNLLIYVKFCGYRNLCGSGMFGLILAQYTLFKHDWTFYMNDDCWNEPISNLLENANIYPLTAPEVHILRSAKYVFNEKFAGAIAHLPAWDQAIIRSKTKVSLADSMADPTKSNYWTHLVL